jgi:hypothetical protein
MGLKKLSETIIKTNKLKIRVKAIFKCAGIFLLFKTGAEIIKPEIRNRITNNNE